MSTDLRTALAALHKADLHRHLEGAVRPGTVAEICRAHRIELPTYDTDDLSALIRLSRPADDLDGFFLPFRIIKLCFVDKKAVARIAYEAVEDAWRDNVRYLELRFSPEFMAFHRRLALTDVMDGIVEGVGLAARRYPVAVNLIVSISRHLSSKTMGVPWPSPEEIARLALDYADRGVVGLDLSGRESGFPPEMFAEPFAMARRAGLGITVHAGEEDGPESIRGAIEHLGAARIGHGVRIVQDADVLRLAVDRGVTLEICPTSNVLTRAVESLESHPVRRLYESGVPITVNTDDPTVCGVTLTDEYALIIEKFGFTLAEIEKLIETARQAAFSRRLE
ncbi:MAG TPA: adenosine deaminase [Armatimonadota bacterium]|nr:adenosine deaminase [Armatimonadota bacterium]